MLEFDGSATGGVKTLATFLLIMAPVYYLFRVLVKLVRQAYGFSDEDTDQEPPLQVCMSCGNTMLESDYAHCPYCGSAMNTTESTVERRPA